MINHTTRLLVLAAVWLGTTATAPAAPPQSVDLGLVRAAPNIVKYLKKQKYQNVGVLKFLVRKGKGAPADNVGSLNLDLARRLEMALIRSVPIDDSLTVIRNASAVAAKLKGGNHRTQAGRARLFEGAYQPAWGKQNSKVSADAFLTGEAAWESDMKEMTVTIFCFDNKGKQVSDLIEIPGGKFQARAGADVLAQGGAPFLLRGSDGEEAAARIAAEVQAGKRPHPLNPDAKPWVKLEIRYNNTPVPQEFTESNVQARIPEPRKGQKVTFVLKRTEAAGAGRLAVVLKVNGENTLFHQRESDFMCTKWILEPGAGPLTIEGFNTDKEEAEKFTVASRKESTGKGMNYDPDLGTISLVVYREQGKVVPPIAFKATEKEEQMALVISRGVYSKELPESREVFWEQFEDLIRKRSNRGWIKPGGEKVRSRVTSVPFVVDPTPIQAARIVYYRP